MGNDKKAGFELARRRLRLIEARSEFAEARSERMIRGCAEEASEIRLVGADQELLDRHAYRTHTRLDAERAIQKMHFDEVALSDVFEGYATRALVSSSHIVELRTSIACVIVCGEVCSWMLAMAAEILHAIEAAADPERGTSVHLVIDDVEAVGLVMTITTLSGIMRPVPNGSGLSAIERASRVMRLFGHLRQSVRGGDVTYVATFAGEIACSAN